VGDLRIVVIKDLASKALAQGAVMGGAGIGKQCAGTRCNNREEWVLASNALGTR
jgi:hypothetical protein